MEGESDRISFIVGTFKNEEPSRVMVYSFDYDLDYELIDELKLKYYVGLAPLVIVNEKDRVALSNIDELERYL